MNKLDGAISIQELNQLKGNYNALIDQKNGLYKENQRYKKVLEDIAIGEDNLAEYTECNNWAIKWWQNPKYEAQYDSEDLCPQIDCGVCIAKQALKGEG